MTDELRETMIELMKAEDQLRPLVEAIGWSERIQLEGVGDQWPLIDVTRPDQPYRKYGDIFPTGEHGGPWGWRSVDHRWAATNHATSAVDAWEQMLAHASPTEENPA